MKKLSARAIAMLTNGILALILIVVGAVCFFPSSSHVSGVKDRVIYRGGAEDGGREGRGGELHDFEDERRI